ncbi:MAG: hypothetical protein II060_02730, partial [Bacteroidales bacterium]|nr:hypothetical protein [Bacteroidales bacterium]
DGNIEIGTYSGTSSPGTVVATTGQLIVEWYSDSSVTGAGWEATVTASGCGSAPQVITGSPDCESAQAFCATNDNPGYDMIVESGSSDTYPSGMCSFFRNPTWWYLRISQDGPIEMRISSTAGDVDFGCWGPFANTTCSPNDLSDDGANGFYVFDDSPEQHYSNTSLSEAYHTTETPICEVAALASPSGNLVDFGGSISAVEYLQIPNARVGQIYVLIIGNYSNNAGTITFVQTNINDPNAGRSDCTIVNDCEITSITVDEISNCTGNGTYSVSGNIHFNNVPADGTLTVSAAGVSQVFRPPFSSPQSYSLSGLPGNGEHDVIITAEFASSTINCDKINYFDAPMCQTDCPDATVAMTGYDEYTDGRYYYDVCLRSGVNMVGTQTGYTNPSWVWSINPHGGQRPYVINGQNASYTPAAEQGYDISLTVSEGECSTVAYGRIRVSGGLETSVSDYALGEICVGDSREVTIGGSGSDIQVNPTPHTIETSLGHAETTFIPDGLNCETQCYESSVTFYDFDDGALVTNTDAIRYIKLNTEHSFIGDIQIKITCPERNGVRRSAIILQDYYSNDPNSNIYSGNAIDAYTYNWPYMTTTTIYRVGPSSSSFYTGDNLIGYTANTPEGRTFTSGGNTYYFMTFLTNADAWNFVHNYLEGYFPGHTYEVYSINSGEYYAIAYTVTDDNGSTRYYVYMTNDVTAGSDAYTFQTEEAAQYYLNTVYGGSGVITAFPTNHYSLVYFGEPDVYDRVDAQNMTSAEICDGTNPHNTHGTGYDYAWTSNSQYTTVGHVYDVANVTSPSTVYSGGTIYDSQSFTSLYHVLPSDVDAGTQMYQPFENFSSLIGCPLNGTWTISVCDSWEKDNGYVFDWEIALSEDLLPSNWDYTVALDEVSNDCGSIATVSGNNMIVAPQTATNGEQTCNINLSDNLGCTTNIPMSYNAVAPTITHVATSGNEIQTVCEGQQINDIVYTLGGVAVGATISWSPSAPDGVAMNVSGNTVTISGAPTTHNTYNYTITTVSQTGLHCTEQTATGRIIVNEGNVLPTFAQAGPYCEGTTVADLPTTSTNGITGHWSPSIT